jgi:hypothetical protein
MPGNHVFPCHLCGLFRGESQLYVGIDKIVLVIFHNCVVVGGQEELVLRRIYIVDVEKLCCQMR